MSKRFLPAACAAVASLCLASAASAGTVDLSAYVNSDAKTYTSGSDYPNGLVTIGGIDFLISSIGNGGTGVIQLGSDESVSIADNETGVDTAYVIVNSGYGVAGKNIGSLTFLGAGSDQISVDLIEGVNIRDHWTAYNNVATDIFATATYPGGNRFDVYRYDISALGGTLTGIEFASTSLANFPNGQPFLAAVTTTFEGAVGGVPEPASWALMISGFGLAGAALRARRRLVAA